MKIYHTIPENKNLLRNPVVTIGSFDGVHTGHRKIFEKLIEIAARKNADPVVITFSTHPRKILNPGIRLTLLTTTDEKINALFDLGIDNIILLNFTREMANMTAEEFYNEILLKKIDVKDLVIGYDHAFGKNREGNYEFLNRLQAASGISVTRVDEALYEGKPVSSTWIRELIQQGDMEGASRLLGREYRLTGRVVKGKGRGAGLGFPTANIIPIDADKIIPGDGVYAVSLLLEDERPETGMLNIGLNPTFGDTGRTIEANIFDFNETIYETHVTVIFHKKIRDERTFASVGQLREQLERDRQEVMTYFKNR